MGMVFMSPASGSTTSDECTAKKEHVLTGYIAVTSDSDDEPVTGTMPNNGAQSATLKCGESKEIPAGYTPGGTVTAADLASQTKAALDSKKMVSGTSGYDNGKLISGAMIDRGAYAYGNSFGEGGDYYAINNIPDGWYHETAGTESWSPEVRLSKDAVRNFLGITAPKIKRGQSIAGVAGTGIQNVYSMGDICWYGFSSDSADPGPREFSFTMPAQGVVYYSGFSASYASGGTVRAEIYKNGALVDSRNIDSSNSYTVRGTMVNKKFAAAKDDVIRLVISATGSTASIGGMFANIVYD